MGDAVDRLRDLVNLSIRVPSYVRHVDGKFIHVDAYTRKGKPAEKAPPKPQARVARTIPATLYAPQDLQTNENVKVAIDTIRQTLVTDLKGSGEPVGDWLADPDTRDTLKSHAYLFDAVRKPTHKGELTKAGKIMAGREWGRYDTLIRTSTLLARMESGSITKPEATKEFWDLMDNRLVPKVMGADYPISVSNMRNSLIARGKNLGIDTGSHVPAKPTGEEPPEAKVDLPGLPGVKVTPPAPEPIELIPGVITPGIGQKGEWEVKPGDEVYVPEDSKTPMQAANLLIRHPDGSAHIIGAAAPGGVMQAPSGIMAALGTSESGWHLYGKVPGVQMMGGKIDVLTVDVPQPSGEGTKKVVVGPGDEIWKGYGGAVGIHHLDDSWTVYDLGPPKHITKDEPGTGWAAWDKVGKGENQAWEQIEPETVKASPPPKAEAPPAPEPKAPPKPKTKKKPKTVIPTVPLDGDDLDTLKNPTVSYGAGDGVDQFMTKQRQRYLKALTAVQQEMGSAANASDYWVTALGKQSTIDLLTEIVGKMETARTDPDMGLQPGQKAKLAKDRKRYEALLEAGTLARDLDTLPEDELDARMVAVGMKLGVGAGYYDKGPYTKMFTKGSKAWQVPNWPYNQKTIYPALQTRVEKRLFEVRSEELGFDYMVADDAALASFIADKGAGDIAPWLSTEQKQDWIRVWLRDPSILDKYSPGYGETDKYGAVLQQITKAATVSMSVDKVTKMANLDLHTQPEPEGPDADQQKAIAAQLVEAQKRFELLKDLKRQYAVIEKNVIKKFVRQKDDGVWEVNLQENAPAGSWTDATESEVLDLLVSGEKWDKVTEVKALTQHMLDEAEAQQLLGMPTGAATRKVQNTWIKDHGGSNVGKMTQPEREQWIEAHLMGNNLMKYALEDRAGKKAKNPVPHPGLTTHPGSPESPAGKAAWLLFSDQAAISVWGTIYRDDKSVGLWMPEEVLTFATAMHLDYGYPPDSGGIPEAVARARVADFISLVPGSMLPPPSPGLETVVPGEPPKGPQIKPDDVSDDVFSLVEALKVLTPDQHAVALFSTTADKFSNEQVDVYLKNSSIFGQSNALPMAGIYSAPLPVKQATIAVMKGLDEEAPFPEGFMDYIKAQVQAGVFDPPKPEGYYGAVSNGETVYYLKPGDKVMEAGEYQTVSVPAPGAVAGPAGLPTQVTAEGGATVVLQPGEKAYQFSKPDGEVFGSLSIRHPDGSWTIGAGTSKANKMTPEAALKNGWEAPNNEPTGVYHELVQVGAGPSPTQTMTAPPKDEVYNNPLKPGDTVYIPPGYALGDTSVRVLHQDGSVDVVDPDGTHFLQTYTAQEWLAVHNWTLIMTGPTTTVPAVGHGPYELQAGDVVYSAGTSDGVGVVYVRRADGSWRRLHADTGLPFETVNMFGGIGDAGSGIAKTLEDWVIKQKKTPIENPAEKYPGAFTAPEAPTTTNTVETPHGTFALAPGDQVLGLKKEGVGHAIRHATGGWTVVYEKPPWKEYDPDSGLAQAWEQEYQNALAGKSEYTVIATYQAPAAPPLTKVHGFPVTPTDKVYTFQGSPLETGPTAYIVHDTGDAHVVEGHQGLYGAIKHAMPDSLLKMKIDKQVGSGELKPVVGAGPMTLPPLGHGPIKLKLGDKVVKDPTLPNTVWVIGADASAAKINATNGHIIKEYPAGTVKETTPIGSYSEVTQPGNAYPNAFTEPAPSLAPGAGVVQPKSVLWVQHGDGTGSWITADGVENVTDEQVDGLFAASHPYIPLKPTSLPPKPIETYKQAQEMGLPPGVPPSLWAVAASADELPEDWSPPDLVATDEEIRTGLLTAKATFGVEVSMAFVENAPPQVQRALYDHLASGAPPEVLAPLVGVMNWKADHQHWGSKTYKPPFPANKPYTPYILAGLTDSTSVASWPYDALQQFQIDYSVNGADAITSKLNEVLVGKKSVVPIASAANEPLKFSEDKDAPHPGGSHSGNRDIKDQHGNKYLYKVYQNDPQSPAMRVEQEVYSARISQLLGYHHPPVQDPVTVLGKYAYIQLKVPFKFDMQGVHPEDLDDNILRQVAEEHVLDWILANADTYYSNIAVSGDGKHVIGIDKGQAFKKFPNDELSPTYTGGNPIAPYYNDLYAAVVSHKITKERADEMVRHLLIRAKRVAQAHDPEHRALLEKAFASRTDFKGMTKDEFIDALMERKHAAAESFEELWKGVYAKAGYSWDLPPLDELQFAKVETPRGAAWAGISPEYFEAVEETKVHGRAAMFAGTDLEDGHLLFFEEHDTEGKRVLLGEGKLREDADGRLTAWLQAQKVADASGSPVLTQQVYVLPNNDAWYQKIVAAAMTVNHHAEDGEYNQAHLDALDAVRSQILVQQASIQEWKQAPPGAPAPSNLPPLPDSDAVAAYADMIDTYLTIIGEIQTAKTNQAKTPNKKYTQFVYTPKAKAKVDEEWKSQTHTLQKTEDGVWHYIDESTGSDEVISEEQAQTYVGSGNFGQGSQGKAVTSLQVKVYKRPASRPEGQLNLNTGELKESGGEETTGASGQEYDVEIGDHIVLEYRPWHGANQPLADQGFFRIRVKNWDGDEADLDQAFQQLAAMGVDLTPADEESLELLYWRLWEGVASTRASVPVAVQTVLKNIKAWRTQNPHASATEELEFLRQAWTPYLGADKVENVDFMPKFDHTRIQNPEEETGHPYWYRPDATLDDMLDSNGQWHFGSQDVLYGPGQEADKPRIAKSGGLLSSDERLRLYGHWIQRGSSTGDKPHGSTGQIFTHPHLNGYDHIAFVPDVFLRMQTYAASSDKWGDVANKANYAPFSVEGLKKASTEMMVKNTVAVLDSFIVLKFANSSDRDAAVKWYHDHGIDSIRGVPIEERFIVANSLNASTVAKLWEKELAWRAEQKQEAALAA